MVRNSPSHYPASPPSFFTASGADAFPPGFSLPEKLDVDAPKIFKGREDRQRQVEHAAKLSCSAVFIDVDRYKARSEAERAAHPYVHPWSASAAYYVGETWSSLYSKAALILACRLKSVPLGPDLTSTDIAALLVRAVIMPPVKKECLEMYVRAWRALSPEVQRAVSSAEADPIQLYFDPPPANWEEEEVGRGSEGPYLDGGSQGNQGSYDSGWSNGPGRPPEGSTFEGGPQGGQGSYGPSWPNGQWRQPPGGGGSWPVPGVAPSASSTRPPSGVSADDSLTQGAIEAYVKSNGGRPPEWLIQVITAMTTVSASLVGRQVAPGAKPSTAYEREMTAMRQAVDEGKYWDFHRSDPIRLRLLEQKGLIATSKSMSLGVLGTNFVDLDQVADDMSSCSDFESFQRGFFEFLKMMQEFPHRSVQVGDRIAWWSSVTTCAPAAPKRSVIAFVRAFMGKYRLMAEWLPLLQTDAALLFQHLYSHGSAYVPGHESRKRLRGDGGRQSRGGQGKKSSASSGGGSTRRGRAVPVCHSRMKKSASCSHVPCKFSHACGMCGADHRAADCSSWSDEAVKAKFPKYRF